MYCAPIPICLFLHIQNRIRKLVSLLFPVAVGKFWNRPFVEVELNKIFSKSEVDD